MTVRAELVKPDDTPGSWFRAPLSRLELLDQQHPLSALAVPPVESPLLSLNDIRKLDIKGRLLPYEEQRDKSGRNVLVESQLQIETRLNDALGGYLGYGIDVGRPNIFRGYDRTIHQQDADFCRRTKGVEHGDSSITRLLHQHGSLIPHYRTWRAQHPETPLVILNIDSHHDEYIEACISRVNSATWAYRLNRLENTSVLHLPSSYAKDTPHLEHFPIDPKTVWHDHFDQYARLSQHLCAEAGTELWLTIDYDYFCLRGAENCADQKRWNYQEHVEAELNQLVRLCQAIQIVPSKIIPVLSSAYLPMKPELQPQFAEGVTVAIHRFLGGLATEQ